MRLVTTHSPWMMPSLLISFTNKTLCTIFSSSSLTNFSFDTVMRGNVRAHFSLHCTLQIVTSHDFFFSRVPFVHMKSTKSKSIFILILIYACGDQNDSLRNFSWFFPFHSRFHLILLLRIVISVELSLFRWFSFSHRNKKRKTKLMLQRMRIKIESIRNDHCARLFPYCVWWPAAKWFRVNEMKKKVKKLRSNANEFRARFIVIETKFCFDQKCCGVGAMAINWRKNNDEKNEIESDPNSIE